MSRIRTSLLAALLIASAIIAVMSWSHLSAAKTRAELSYGDLAAGCQSLADLRAAASTSPNLSPNSAAGDSPVNQLLREAAVESGASSKLTGIEPGQPARIEGTDYQETPVFLRLDPMPLKQLVTFLHATSAPDPRARCRSIELSAGDSPDAWSADITMGYLSYSPRGAKP